MKKVYQQQYEKLDELFGKRGYVMLSDSDYSQLRDLVQILLDGGYIREDHDINNARNVFQKTDKYLYFLTDQEQEERNCGKRQVIAAGKGIAKWLLGIVAGIAAAIISALILYWRWGIKG